MKGDSLEVSDDTPMFNPQGLSLKTAYLNGRCVLSFIGIRRKNLNLIF